MRSMSECERDAGEMSGRLNRDVARKPGGGGDIVSGDDRVTYHAKAWSGVKVRRRKPPSESIGERQQSKLSIQVQKKGGKCTPREKDGQIVS
jgi:hypothetical protein